MRVRSGTRLKQRSMGKEFWMQSGNTTDTKPGSLSKMIPTCNSIIAVKICDCKVINTCKINMKMAIY
jgi:hypothetical protein